MFPQNSSSSSSSVKVFNSYNQLMEIDKQNMPLDFDLSGEHDEFSRDDWFNDININPIPYWDWVILKVQDRIEEDENDKVIFQKDCKNGVYPSEIDVAN